MSLPGAMASSPEAVAREGIGRCWALIRAGRCLEARSLLSSLAEDTPRLPGARRMLAPSLQGQGDLDGAEEQIRAAILLDRSDPALLARLGEILFAKGAWSEAERTLRGALALNRFFVAATVTLTRLLLAMGRPAEALQVTTPLALRPDAPAAVLEAQVAALRAMGKPEDALVVAARARRVACAEARP